MASALSPPLTAQAAYAAARQALNAVEFFLQQCEQAAGDGGGAGVAQGAGAAATGGGAAASLSDDDSMRRQAAAEAVNRLQASVAALQRVVAADFSGVAAASAKAELWRKRAAQLSAEADALRAAVARYLQSSFLVARARAEREARHRLFDGAGGGGAGGGAAVAVDALLAERASAGSSARMLDEYLATAGGVLGALKAQRATFKGAHKRALDVAASLGLSSSLLRLIERRTTADKILVYGGMALICVLVGLVLLWLQRG